MSAVADVVGLSLPSVSKLIEGLVSLGYIRHEVCPQDRRRARLYASDKGKLAMARGRAEIGSHLTERLGELEPEARQAVHRGLLHLQEVFSPPRSAQQ
jgi:MarR family transcriptional regulator for hemolysin